MFNKLLVVVFSVFCILGIAYLAFPNCDYPSPPPGVLKSQEPADLESPLRQGYFTNYSREEILSWYKEQFSCPSILGIKIPKLLLNYPPEYAQTIIRDRTDIGWLQEYVYPMREGIYINGFAPAGGDGQPILTVDGELWKQKIIVKQVSSNVWVRETLFVLSALGIVMIYRGYQKLFSKHD